MLPRMLIIVFPRPYLVLSPTFFFFQTSNLYWNHGPFTFSDTVTITCRLLNSTLTSSTLFFRFLTFLGIT